MEKDEKKAGLTGQTQRPQIRKGQRVTNCLHLEAGRSRASFDRLLEDILVQRPGTERRVRFQLRDGLVAVPRRVLNHCRRTDRGQHRLDWRTPQSKASNRRSAFGLEKQKFFDLHTLIEGIETAFSETIWLLAQETNAAVARDRKGFPWIRLRFGIPASGFPQSFPCFSAYARKS